MGMISDAVRSIFGNAAGDFYEENPVLCTVGAVAAVAVTVGGAYVGYRAYRSVPAGAPDPVLTGGGDAGSPYRSQLLFPGPDRQPGEDFSSFMDRRHAGYIDDWARNKWLAGDWLPADQFAAQTGRPGRTNPF